MIQTQNEFLTILRLIFCNSQQSATVLLSFTFVKPRLVLQLLHFAFRTLFTTDFRFSLAHYNVLLKLHKPTLWRFFLPAVVPH